MIGDKVLKPLIEKNDKGEIITDRTYEYTQLANWCNSNNALIEEKTNYYIAVSKPETEALKAERNTLTEYLNSTDWMVIKSLEKGSTMQQEYPEDFVKRENARARINEIDRIN